MRNKLPVFFICLACLARATTYYVATNGVSGNTGLSTNSPWPMSYVFTHIAAGDTVLAMPGTYTNQVIIRTSNTTFKPLGSKWTVKIKGWGATGNCIVVWPPPLSGVVIDGFEVDHSPSEGIHLYSSNSVVRNCWVHDSGAVPGVNIGSGIVSQGALNANLIENCLLENNGYSVGFDHGIYLAGTNCIIRNNVIRNNKGLGISLYSGTGGIDHCQVYGNLIYSNWGRVDLGKAWQIGVNNVDGASPRNGTNWVYCNTVIGTNQYLIFVQYGTVGFTNNIMVFPSGNGFDLGPSAIVMGDYTVSPFIILAHGPHDLTSTNYGFVNTAKGLYWLSNASGARGRALSGVFGPVDFFGATQSSVADCGAFQYQPVYSADGRTLDPSPSGGADYWAPINFIFPVAPSQLIISKKN